MKPFKIGAGLIDIFIICILFPAYSEIMETLVEVMESILHTPLTPTMSIIFYSLPIVFLAGTFFWFGWGIYRSRNRGGIRF